MSGAGMSWAAVPTLCFSSEIPAQQGSVSVRCKKSSLLAKLWLFMNARSATEEAHADTSALH